MVYQWKIPIAPVSAQTAGEEFERLYEKNGRLAPEDVVDESRPESAPLHECFEWNDEVAAEKYRVVQAGNIIRAIVKVEPAPEAPAQTVRAFVHVRQDYHPISVVVKNPDMSEELLANARREMVAFIAKYKSLKKLFPIIDAMQNFIDGFGEAS